MMGTYDLRMTSILNLFLICLSCSTAFQGQGYCRRRFINESVISVVGSGIAGNTIVPGPLSVADREEKKENDMNMASSFNAFKILPDESSALSPRIEPIQPAVFQNMISHVNRAEDCSKPCGGVVWLGEHHNSAQDHKLQAEFINTLHLKQLKNHEEDGKGSNAPAVSIGLEQIQIQYQQHLDDFVTGKISEDDMLKLVQWEERWSWPYENYRPVFSLARDRKIPLIALNVNSEDLAVVETRGIEGLSKEQLQRYIKDPKGFDEFARLKSYSSYVNYVIEPSYNLHLEMNLLKRTRSGIVLDEQMPFRNFFCARILWDEAMACNAVKWLEKNRGGIMVGLIGADHVKFRNGVPGRFNYLSKGEYGNTSVILNPTLSDARPPRLSNVESVDISRSPELTLQLRYLKDGIDPSSADSALHSNTGGVLPFSDFIVMTSNA